ncbi:Ribonuclease D (EC 3.1.26.3) [uncultured Gammaproteobacteria bacterium]|nr:Ribonuclease D (EC 3.1.26.3) [uncultured Gammaproteobacteria bacterium]
MIQTQTQLHDFLHRIKDETELAIDTEFKWTNTYYPKLCLLQIASETVADCIDILAIENLAPLFDKLYQKNMLWIAHAAHNDIEVLYRYSKQLPSQVFDTQIAPDLLKNLRPEGANFGAQMSYQTLTEILQSITLEKAYTRLDWTTRPLPEEAIEYALDDVRYLIKNYHQLKAQLNNEQKLNWLMEEGQSLLNIDLYEVDIFQSWQKVKGFSRLPKQMRHLAAQLAAWREYCAIDKDKPRRWILSDNDLINIVLGKDGLSDKKQQAFEYFLAKYPQSNEIIYDTRQHTPPTAEEKAQKAILQKAIQEKANQYNLTMEIIVNSKTLLRYIRGDQSVNFLSGWRFNLLKEELKNAK